MSGKKRPRASLEDELERPWCYYCERDFDNLRVLLDHQKAKHFKCETCGRRLNTAGGLHVHMSQVHKEPLSQVENAIPGRHTGDIEIFGMEGIPAQIVEEFRQRVIAKYYQEHGPPVQQKQGPGKKIKKETAEELKARLAVFRAEKAKRAAEQAAEQAAEKDNIKSDELQASSDAGQGGGNNVDTAGSPAPSTFPHQQTPEVGYPGYPQPSPGPAGYYPGNMMPDYMPPFAMPPQYPQNPYGAPPQQYGGQYGGQHGWGGPPQYVPPAHNYPFAGPPHQAPPGIASYSPPPQAFPHKPQHGLPSGPPGLSAPVRTPSLTPAPPGLPQKPSFTPSVSHFQLQQMHQSGGHAAPVHGQGVKHDQGSSAPHQAQSHIHNVPKVEREDVEMQDVFEQNTTKSNPTAADVDALIAEYAPKPVHDTQQSTATAQPPVVDTANTPAPKDQDPAAPAAATKGKKGKSKVEKTFKLKLQDNKTSPEEKLASSPRYSFTTKTRKEQEREANTVLGEIEAQVTGPERDEVELADKTG